MCYLILEDSSLVLLEGSSLHVPDETDHLPYPPLNFFDSMSSLQYMDYISNTVDFLTCNSSITPLNKDTSTPFAWLTPKAYAKEYFHWFGDCFFSSEVPSIYPKKNMDIHSPAFDDLNLIKTDILPLIFDIGEIMSISPWIFWYPLLLSQN